MKAFCGVRFFWKVGLLAALCHVVSGWPGGAPGDACPAMDPGFDPVKGHLKDGKENAGASIPTSFVPVTSTGINGVALVAPGGKLDMKVAAVGGAVEFKGFFLQVRSKKEAMEALGTFEVPSGVPAKLVECHGGKNNAATHNSRDLKKEVTVKWTAPSDAKPGSYVVVSTIVKDQHEYYVQETYEFKIAAGDSKSGTSTSGASLFVVVVTVAVSSVVVSLHL